jgi:hypothetical protein
MHNMAWIHIEYCPKNGCIYIITNKIITIKISWLEKNYVNNKINVENVDRLKSRGLDS